MRLQVSIHENDFIICEFKRDIRAPNEPPYGTVFPLDQPYNPAWAAGPSTGLALLDYHDNSKMVYNDNVRMTDVIPVISLDECGKSKGCLMNPPDCNSTENCQQFVTFQVSPSNSSRIRFEMYSSSRYLNLGLYCFWFDSKSQRIHGNNLKLVQIKILKFYFLSP